MLRLEFGECLEKRGGSGKRRNAAEFAAFVEEEKSRNSEETKACAQIEVLVSVHVKPFETEGLENRGVLMKHRFGHLAIRAIVPPEKDSDEFFVASFEFCVEVFEVQFLDFNGLEKRVGRVAGRWRRRRVFHIFRLTVGESLDKF